MGTPRTGRGEAVDRDHVIEEAKLSKKMNVKVDTDICTGCGLCADTCPEVFDIDEDVAVTKVDSVPPEAEDLCQDAVEGCPVEAISIEE